MTRRYLLDSGPAQDYVQRRPPVYQRGRAAVSSGAVIGICPPVLGELVGGCQFSHNVSRELKRLKRALSQLLIWPFDEKAAYEYGQVYAILRRIGRPMQQIDMQVAAVALAIGWCTVVTADTGFQNIPGQAVEDWSK